MRLIGHRVRLRPLAKADRERVVAIRRTAEVARWWRGGDLHLEFHDDLADDELHQLAIESLDGVVVGVVQFAEEDDPDYRHASVDVFVDPAMHRRGFATDAIVTLARHLFEQRRHHRLVIDPSVDNDAAIACYTTVGFRPVGVMRAYERRADGTWSDGLLMDLLRSDFERAHPSGATPVPLPARAVLADGMDDLDTVVAEPIERPCPRCAAACRVDAVAVARDGEPVGWVRSAGTEQLQGWILGWLEFEVGTFDGSRTLSGRHGVSPYVARLRCEACLTDLLAVVSHGETQPGRYRLVFDGLIPASSA